jgi:hypothetical protein
MRRALDAGSLEVMNNLCCETHFVVQTGFGVREPAHSISFACNAFKMPLCLSFATVATQIFISG